MSNPDLEQLADRVAERLSRPFDDGSRVYKASELRDHSFYRAHRDDIMRAVKDGRVVDDLAPDGGPRGVRQ